MIHVNFLQQKYSAKHLCFDRYITCGDIRRGYRERVHYTYAPGHYYKFDPKKLVISLCRTYEKGVSLS